MHNNESIRTKDKETSKKLESGTSVKNSGKQKGGTSKGVKILGKYMMDYK